MHVAAAGLHNSTLECTDTFYVCQGCGHVYWAGSHLDKYVANLGGIVGGRGVGGGGGDGAHVSTDAGGGQLGGGCGIPFFPA